MQELDLPLPVRYHTMTNNVAYRSHIQWHPASGKPERYLLLQCSMVKSIPGAPLRAALIALFLAAVFVLSFTKIEDTDAWTHLNFGRLIWETRQLPSVEPFITTGAPFPYNNWLFGLVFYLAYAVASFGGVITLKAALATAAFALVLADSLRPHRNIAISLAVAAAAFIIVRSRVVERPDLVLFVFLALSAFSLNAYLYEGRKYLYALPLVHLLWGNMHTSIPLMVVPFLAFLIGSWGDTLLNRTETGFRMNKQQTVMIGSIFGLSFLFSLIGPYFIYQYTHSIQAVISPWWTQGGVQELHAPDWSGFRWPFIVVGLLAASFVLNFRRASLAHLLLVLPLAYLSLKFIRFTFPFAVVAAPVIARNLSDFVRNPGYTVFQKNRAAVLCGIILVAALTLIVYAPQSNLKVLGVGINPANVPEGALQYMDRNQIDGKVFNTFHFGGYITWRDYPRRKAFIDGRGFLDDRLLQKTSEAAYSNITLNELEAAYGFESVIIEHPGLSHPQWKLVYWDDVSLLYLKTGGRFDGVIKRDAYEVIKPAFGLALSAERLADAAYMKGLLGELERNVKESGSILGKLFLANCYNALGRFGEVPRVLSNIDSAWLAMSNLDRPVFSALAEAYYNLGRADKAEHYYEQAAGGGTAAAILPLLSRATDVQ